MGNLAKYNVALARIRPESNTLSGSKTRNTPYSWGVSCFGIRQRPTFPGVSHRALFPRGTRMLVPSGRSLRFPTLRLAVSPTGRARLRSHRRRAMGNLTKYNVALTRRRPGSWTHCPAQKEINPTFVGLISFWNPATSYSPGRFSPCCIAHRARTAGNLAKYNAAPG